MKYDNDEILTALKIIANVCYSNDCPTCSLGCRDGGCRITQDCPNNWDLVADAEPVWRAFKDEGGE